MKQTLALLTGLLLLAAGTIHAYAADVTFGTGGNQFSIEFVEIGNAGNAADTTGNPNPAGSVGYDYSISKYEISQNMITAATNSGLTGVTAGAHTGDKPAANVSWYEAAKFVNWLNTSSGGSAAYKFDGGGNFQLWDSGDTLDYDASNQYRSLRATYWLPSADEWYKAAYYDVDTATYYDYATGSDTAPTSVTNGTTTGTAVYDLSFSTGPADIDDAGGLSPFGTMAQNGNAWEWEETASDLGNDSAGEDRVVRGGSWDLDPIAINGRSESRGAWAPTSEAIHLGFRVAAVSAPADSDGDGVPDDEDACPDSIMGETIVIDDCDSGVENIIDLFGDGCTLADLIQFCAEEAENHGDFVSCVAHLTNGLKKGGVLTGKEKRAIQKCAAKSGIGK